MTNFATTPTTQRGEPIAGNVGVLEFPFASRCAATSTLSAAAAAERGKAGGVGVAVLLIPTTSARTSTPSARFLEAAAMTSVADVTFYSSFAATLVTGLAKRGGRTGEGMGTEEGRGRGG